MSHLQTILLTGATGFIGSHLLEALLAKGYKVVILKRSTSNTWRISHLLNQVVSYDVDLQPLDLAFEKHNIEVVIHLATLYRKFENGQEVAEMINANVTFPTRLLELGTRNGIRAFINTGTFFECDCSIMPLGENVPNKPFNLYAKTKIAFEGILLSYRDKMNIQTLRLFSPYGENDNDKLIPMIIKKALSKDEIKLSEGFQKLDFIYVKDIVNAYLKAIHKASDNEAGYEVYNIGSGVPVSIREVVSVIEEGLGYPILKEWGKPSEVDIPVVYGDISKAARELKWSLQYSLREGLENTVQHYAEKNNL